ncbi:MAG: AIR carboxylase family protein, partial [Actinomycetota bacterium]|nr:AIR carboxylase family protein [Actinomycetota bacterium]
YATVQMPPGIPVATVAVDGSRNAGILVAEMLSITDDEIAKKLAEFRAAGAR